MPAAGRITPRCAVPTATTPTTTACPTPGRPNAASTPTSPHDGPADPDGDGYTNLEDYLNGLAGDLEDR